MVERRRLHTPNGKEYKPGEGNKAGRKPGVPNALTTSLRNIILTAVEMIGADGKGTDGAVGYFKMIASCRPDLMVRLVERMMPLPLQVTGKDEGPIEVVELTRAREMLFSRLKQIEARVINDEVVPILDEPPKPVHH